MDKWSGHGHNQEGAATTSLGELAVECPACPHSDHNLPLNWNSGGLPKYFNLFYHPKVFINLVLICKIYIHPISCS
jgi:hypothetical protein